MGIAAGWLMVWMVHAGTALALAVPAVYLGRNRVQWHLWELFAVVVPFAVWTLLLSSQSIAGKSMSNFAIELLLVTIAVPLAAVVRVFVGRLVAERITAGALIFSLTGLAAAVYWSVPALPE